MLEQLQKSVIRLFTMVLPPHKFVQISTQHTKCGPGHRLLLHFPNFLKHLDVMCVRPTQDHEKTGNDSQFDEYKGAPQKDSLFHYTQPIRRSQSRSLGERYLGLSVRGLARWTWGWSFEIPFTCEKHILDSFDAQ